MISIIFWIIFIGVIVSNIKKKSQKKNGGSSFAYQAKAGGNPYNTGMNRSSMGSFQNTQNVRGTATGYASDAREKSAGTAESGFQKPRKKEAKDPSKPSTLDYLNEKAKQDQREHAMEKMEERKRASVKYGNRPVGGRYLLGDPIPRGMKIVCCKYCGAENVVNIGYRGDRDCYFCRTRLEV